MTIAHKEALLPFRKRPWLVFPVRPRSRERSFLLYNERLLKTSCSLTPDLEQDKKMIIWQLANWPVHHHVCLLCLWSLGQVCSNQPGAIRWNFLSQLFPTWLRSLTGSQCNDDASDFSHGDDDHNDDGGDFSQKKKNIIPWDYWT